MKSDGRSAHMVGLLSVASAAVLWGIGGVAAQDLFQHHNISPIWLVCVRMAGAGLLLLVVFRPRWPGRYLGRLLVLAVFGMAGTQYTWFEAIAHSNVASATFIQYSGVAMTAGWQMLRGQIRSTVGGIAAVVAALGGVVLLVLGQPGGVRALQVNPLGAAFAFASAVAFSFYLLGSARLVRAIGSLSTTAWGLAVAGVLLTPWASPWQVRPVGGVAAVVGLILLVVVACTALAFGLSVAGLRRVTATEAAVTSTVEPAVAGVVGAQFLGVALYGWQYVGGALTLAAVVLLALAHRSRPEEAQQVSASPPE